MTSTTTTLPNSNQQFVQLDPDDFCIFSQATFAELAAGYSEQQLPLFVVQFFNEKKHFVYEAGAYLHYLETNGWLTAKKIELMQPTNRGIAKKVDLLVRPAITSFLTVPQKNVNSQEDSKKLLFYRIGDFSSDTPSQSKISSGMYHYCCGSSLQIPTEARLKSLAALFLKRIQTGPAQPAPEGGQMEQLVQATSWEKHLLQLAQELFLQATLSNELSSLVDKAEQLHLSGTQFEPIVKELALLQITNGLLIKYQGDFQSLEKAFSEDQTSLSLIQRLQLGFFLLHQYSATKESACLATIEAILKSFSNDASQHAIIHLLSGQWALAVSENAQDTAKEDALKASVKDFQTILKANPYNYWALDNLVRLYKNNTTALASSKKRLIDLLNQVITTSSPHEEHWRIQLVHTLLAEQPVSIKSVQQCIQILEDFLCQTSTSTASFALLFELIKLYFWFDSPPTAALENGYNLVQRILERDPHHAGALYYWLQFVMHTHSFDRLITTSEEEANNLLEFCDIVEGAIKHHAAHNTRGEATDLLLETYQEVSTWLEIINQAGFKRAYCLFSSLENQSEIKQLLSSYMYRLSLLGPTKSLPDVIFNTKHLDLPVDEKEQLATFAQSSLFANTLGNSHPLLFSPYRFARKILDALKAPKAPINCYEDLARIRMRYMGAHEEPPANLSLKSKCLVYSLLAIEQVAHPQPTKEQISKADEYITKALKCDPDSSYAHGIRARLLLFPEEVQKPGNWHELFVSIDKAKPLKIAYYFEIIALTRLGILSDEALKLAQSKIEQLKVDTVPAPLKNWLKEQLAALLV